MKIKEYRNDGWPLCPNCGEDELWSPLLWDGENERPPLQTYIDAGLTCYACQWTDRRNAVAEVASALAAEILRQRLEAGREIKVPSLGIVIRKQRQG